MKYIEIAYLILGIISIIKIIDTLGSIGNFFKKKSQVLDNIPYVDKIEYNSRLLNIVLDLIRLEVGNKTRSLKALNVSYNILDMDNDIKDISESVYRAIKTSVYHDTANIFTDEYLIKFITENTTLAILETIEELKVNSKFNNNNEQ